jgi:hypothetical protein
MDVLQLSAQSDTEDDPEPELIEETVMAVSVKTDGSIAKTPSAKRQTIRFKGFIGKQEILVLLDSGSVGTFIRDQMVTSCALSTVPCEAMTFFIADGSPMQSNTMIP